MPLKLTICLIPTITKDCGFRENYCMCGLQPVSNLFAKLN